MDESPPAVIEQWRQVGDSFGVPFAFGEAFWPRLDLKEKFSLGAKFKVPKLPDPKHKNASPDQEKFFADTLREILDLYAVLAVAPTGAGKTVTLLYAIGKIGRTALVIVPSAYLADQWRKQAMLHLGLEWKDIGVLQGAADDWKGKKIVIAVIHNLFLKTWPDEFYKNFGFIAWDEAHKLGARVFSSTMSLFHARYKIAVTATEDRKDGCDALYKNFFGEAAVRAKSEALAMKCYVVTVPHIGTKHFWIDKCKSDVRPMKWLAGLKKRNETIVRIACQMYDDGRTILIATKFIDHAERIIQLLRLSGIPKDDIAQFTRKTSTGKVHGQGFLDLMTSKPVIVATISMMKEGVDIPELDTGVEALPVADCIQLAGRIRRPRPGKRIPKWFTLLDRGIPLFERYTKARLTGFSAQNVEVIHLKPGIL
jgi:superfamily II DNA or RNA helicase